MITQAVRQGCWKDRNDEKPNFKLADEFSAAVGRALRRAAKTARKTARMHGTPVYVWKNGKVSPKNPDLSGRRVNFHVSAIPERGRLPPVREFMQIIPFMASLACSEAVRRIEPMKGPDPRNERGDRLGGLNH